MTKTLPSMLLLVTILSGFALIGLPHYGSVHASSVSGIITLDTTWTKANSPYVLSGPLLVGNNVTLTIEHGVIVQLANGPLQVNGTLDARGTDADKISFVAGSIIFASSSPSWNELTGSGSIIENAIITTLDIRNSSPKINSSQINGATIQGGNAIFSKNTCGEGESISSFDIFDGSPEIMNNFFNKSQISVHGGSPVIAKNNIIGIPTVLNGGDLIKSLPEYGVYLEGENAAYIADNTIAWHSAAGISAVSGETKIERNLVSNNYVAISIGPDANLIIQNNTIANNEYMGIVDAAPSPAPSISYNNFQNNSRYNIYLGTGREGYGNPNNITAAYNWWGTTSTQTISQTIYDFNDDFNLGTINFVPFLTEPNPQAMPDPNAPVTTPSPTPTQTPSPSTSSTPTPSPSPSIPELPSWIIGLSVIGASAFLFMLKKRVKKT